MIIVYYLLNTLLYVYGIGEFFFRKTVDKNFLYLTTFGIFLVFVGLKLQGGTDYFQYREIYENVTFDYFTESVLEPLFTALILIVKYLGGSFGVFYFLVAFCNLTLKFWIFYKLTPYLFPALLIYSVGLFFERDNDGIRQGLAIAFCYLSIPYLLENKNKLFLLFNCVAILLHYTSVIFLLSWIFKKIKIDDKWILWTLGVMFLFPLLKLSATSLLHTLALDVIVVKLQFYMDSLYADSQGINIGIVFRLLILMLFIKNRDRIEISNSLYFLLRNGFAFAIMVSLLFYDFAIIAHRLPYVFREFQVFIVPYFFTMFDRKNKILVLSVVFLYSLVILSRFLFGINYDAFDSYDNVLFHII